MTNTLPPTENWEIEFDRRVKCDDNTVCFFPYGGDSYDFDSDNCKGFIRTLLASETKRAREEVLDMLRQDDIRDLRGYIEALKKSLEKEGKEK